MGISIGDINDILKNLESFGVDVELQKKLATKEGAEKMQDWVKEKAPHDDYFSQNNLKYGTLKDNIRVGYHPRGYYFVSTGDAFWGQFLEFGTKGIDENHKTQTRKRKKRNQKKTPHQNKGITAQPWMEPTFNAHKKELQEIIIQELRKGLF